MISGLPLNSGKCASYLINVKKLIKEHNIDSNEHNLYKMQTKNNITSNKNNVGNEIKGYEPTKELAEGTLGFESRFESGNLLSAMKISDSEYNLVL
jgi:hypothetical protein